MARGQKGRTIETSDCRKSSLKRKLFFDILGLIKGKYRERAYENDFEQVFLKEYD